MVNQVKMKDTIKALKKKETKKKVHHHGLTEEGCPEGVRGEVAVLSRPKFVPRLALKTESSGLGMSKAKEEGDEKVGTDVFTCLRLWVRPM